MVITFRNSGKNVDEAYGITLFGLKRVMEAVNNIDVGQFGAGSLPGVQAHVQTPKSRRIARMQKWPPTNFSVVFVLGRVLFCTIPE